MLPCQTLPPLLVMTLTTDPPLRPYSGPNWLVTITYCPTNSASLTNKAGPPTLLSLLFWPSICWSLLRPRWPLVENPGPFELENVWSRVLTTPGTNRARLSRPSFSCRPAKVCSASPENVLVTCDWVVSIRGAASPDTSSTTDDSPTASLRPIPISAPAETRMPFSTEVLKPWAVASTLYCPGGIRLNRKDPELSLVVLKDAPVSCCVAFTTAPDTTAPWGSVTVPEIEPLTTCPKAGMHHTTARLSASKATVLRSLQLIRVVLHFFLCCVFLKAEKRKYWFMLLMDCWSDFPAQVRTFNRELHLLLLSRSMSGSIMLSSIILFKINNLDTIHPTH